MAQIDFTNAILAPYANTPLQPYRFGLGDGQVSITDVNGNDIGTITSAISNSSPSGFTATLTGTISTGIPQSTEFYIEAPYWSNTIRWKVSNITFQGDDTFILKIDVEIN